jgi:hypothetical protein
MLQDEQTGDYYMIEDVTRQPTLGLPGGKLLTLRCSMPWASRLQMAHRSGHS